MGGIEVRRVETFETELRPLEAADVDRLHALTIGVGWPHRAEDLRLLVAAGEGVIATDPIERPIGSAMWFPSGDDFATVGMVVVAPPLQMRGAGRWLMDRVMERCAGRDLRLVATPEAYRLCRAMGFEPVGLVLRHQGIARAAATPALPPAGTVLRSATAVDFDAIAALDAAAFGADRRRILARFRATSEVVVAETDGAIDGFAFERAFGRGRLIGPLVATCDRVAISLVADRLEAHPGAFVRIDLAHVAGRPIAAASPEALGRAFASLGLRSALAEWLSARGLERPLPTRSCGSAANGRRAIASAPSPSPRVRSADRPTRAPARIVSLDPSPTARRPSDPDLETSVTLSFDPDAEILPDGHFIGGAFVADTGAIDLFRPSDGAAYAASPIGGAEIVDRAVASAAAALKSSGWGSVRPRERVDVLHAWADLIEREGGRLARLEAISATRPIAELIAGDVAITAEQIRFFAEFADKDDGTLVPTGADGLGMVASEPYGVVGAITPWNFPLSMAAWKLGPALAAGNAVVLKPSELTPFSTLLLAELAVNAGLPAGLFNVVLGDGPTTGTALTGHPGIAKVSFTGSTGAGAAIMANVARTGIKPMTLELGGKSAQVVFADADLDLAATCIAGSILANAGQACVAGSRLVVARPVADALVERLVKRMTAVVPGPTWDETSRYSPIVSARQIGRIESIVEAARAKGATALVGGERFDRPGFFYRPTLLAEVDASSPAVIEEIFGPVLTVQIFETEEEALALAGHPTYGLCAGVHTRDLSRAVRVSRALEAGTVWINRYGRSRDHILPTGGWKASGIGKDLGREAYHANRRFKSVLIGL